MGGDRCVGGFVSKTERECLQDGSKNCCDVWFGDVGTDEKTGG